MNPATNPTAFLSPALAILTLAACQSSTYEVGSGEIDTMAGTGMTGTSDDDVPVLDADLYLPLDVTVGPDGRVYVIDWQNNRIRVITDEGRFQTVAGSGLLGEPQPGKATDSDLNHPSSVVFDDAGRMLIATFFNGKIARVDLATGELELLYGNGGRDYTGEGGPAAEATFNVPSSLAHDMSGNLYVTDLANQVIRKVDGSGTITRFAGQCIIDSYPDLTCDPAGSTSACEGSDKLVCTGEAVPDYACGANCAPSFAGDGGPALEARLSVTTSAPPLPGGNMVFDAAGNLYVADTGSHRIRRIDTNGIITTVAGNGNAGYAGDGAPAIDAELHAPSDIAIAGDGTLYVADTYNSCVRAFRPGGVIHTVAGKCSEKGFAGDRGPATEALLDRPYGIALDGADNLYIADTYNHRIRIVPR
jgi:DNA-binding beta-propeller fold protein YncE